MIKVFNQSQLAQQQAKGLVVGTSLRNKIHGYKFRQLVEVLGQPTFPYESVDGKTTKEWVVLFNDEVFTVYDWKTFDEDYTTNQLTQWNVGGKTSSNEFVQYLEQKLWENLNNG